MRVVGGLMGLARESRDVIGELMKVVGQEKGAVTRCGLPPDPEADNGDQNDDPHSDISSAI
jgi:hypothetical protein